MLGFSPIASTPLADDFLPAGPSVGDTLEINSQTYIYDGKKFKLFQKKYSYKGSSPTNINNTTELDLSTGNFFDVSLSEATTFTFANPPASGFTQKFQMKLTITGTVNSITWPSSVLWETGSAPTLPETGQTDILEFYTSDGGTIYYGKLKEDNVS